MKKIQLFFAAFFALSAMVYGQDRMLTIDHIFSTDPGLRVRFSGNPTSVQWTRDGLGFRQVQSGNLMWINALSGDTSEFFDSKKLTTALTRVGIGATAAGQLASTPHFNRAETAVLVNSDNDLYYYELASGIARRLTNNREEEKEPDFSPDGKWVSFVRANDLYVVDIVKGGEKQLTRDGSEIILNGILDWVYEEELYGRGQKRGYWWSPDSNYIAFLRFDESPVPKFVIPNDVETDQEVANTHYPQAGDPNPIVKLGIADVNKRSLVPNVAGLRRVRDRLPTNVLRFGDHAKFVNLTSYKPEDLLIGRVAWAPDSRAVWFQALNREQTQLDLNAATLDGRVRKLFTETTPAWVEVYDDPTFLKDGTALWQSARNGWRHLYHYDSNGKQIRQLTEGKWEVRALHGVDEVTGWVYFTGTKDSHIAENVYRVRLSGGAIERLSKGDGWHAVSFSPTFTHYVENWSDVNTPPQTRLFRADGTLERVINENKVEALNQFRLGRPEFLKVKTRDGFEMEAMMIRPPDFDAGKRYPVMSYIYGGPHAPAVANRWGGNRYMWHQMLAQKGYIVWVLDNRTASGKGEESTWPVYKNMGQLELRDIEDGVAYLKSLPYVDGGRIGMWGWSYGGYMTSYALTHSKAFKMGIAGGIVSDWRLYDSIYTERYMLTPQNNRAGYDSSSILNAAKNLSGRLLLIHGMADDNVHMQNATKLAYELQKADKQFDLMIYPTQYHGITNPTQVKHWYTLMTDYIVRNL